MLQPMTEREIEGFEDYLADVLCLWDCYEQTWVTEGLAILRFESKDVFVACMKPGQRQLSICESSIESAAVMENLLSRNMHQDSCLCWRPWRERAEQIGESVTLKEAVSFQFPSFG